MDQFLASMFRDIVLCLGFSSSSRSAFYSSHHSFLSQSQPPCGVSPGWESKRIPCQPQNSWQQQAFLVQWERSTSNKLVSRSTALFSMPGLRAPNSTWQRDHKGEVDLSSVEICTDGLCKRFNQAFQSQ